jgi:hypothetical protein
MVITPDVHQVAALVGMLLSIEASRRHLPLHLWQRQLGIGVLGVFVACFSVFGTRRAFRNSLVRANASALCL